MGTREKVELWFFRDMSSEQRLALFSLFGMPVDEIGHTHGHQRIALRHVLSALSEQGEAAQPAADWRDAEIAALQEAVRKYGNRAAMSFAPPRLQEAIDRAMIAASPGIASQAEPTPEGLNDRVRVSLFPECSTEGCGHQASVRFERGGVGSYYCPSCYLKVQAIPYSPNGIASQANEQPKEK